MAEVEEREEATLGGSEGWPVVLPVLLGVAVAGWDDVRVVPDLLDFRGVERAVAVVVVEDSCPAAGL